MWTQNCAVSLLKSVEYMLMIVFYIQPLKRISMIKSDIFFTYQSYLNIYNLLHAKDMGSFTSSSYISEQRLGFYG